MENMKGFVLVNLLPYREKIKKEQVKQFVLLMAFCAGIGLSLIFMAHTVLSLEIENQVERNDFIKKENEKLEKQIAEIKNLRDEIKETLEKRRVVESLQVNRTDGVNILNELANKLPEGTAMKSIKKVGEKLTVVGETQSNARVSNYMNNLEDGSVFNKVELVEIKSVVVQNKRPVTQGKKTTQQIEETKIGEFSINMLMERKEEVGAKVDRKAPVKK